MNKYKVTCSLHSYRHLSFDKVSFQVFCTECHSQGLESHLVEDLQTIPDSNHTELPCDFHANEKGCFYCDDCHVFICNICFANEHRNHNSNTPDLISKNLKENISELVKILIDIRPNIEESYKNLSDTLSKIKEFKRQTLELTNLLNSNIVRTLKTQTDIIVKNNIEIYKGIDVEADKVFERIGTFHSKILKNLKIINNILNDARNAKTPTEVCYIYSKNKTEITEIRKFIDDSSYFYNHKINEIKIKIEENLPNLKILLEKFYKSQEIFERSVTSSIISGITSLSIRARRFIKFNMMCKYYKTSSLVFKANKDISLVGLGLCGLYSSKSLIDVKNEELTKKNSSLPTGLTLQKVPLNISVFELKSDEINEKIIDFNFTLPSITNQNDPVVFSYFPKALNIKANSRYRISISNLDKNSMYLQIWGGSVTKNSIESLEQDLVCNNSGINFNFSTALGLESDFNEFIYGIIADLIYCYVE